MTSEDEVARMLADAEALPYGAAKIALLEQVVAHADTLEEPRLAFYARMRATEAYVNGGDPVRSFVSFSWCRTAYDRDPARYAAWTHMFLWHFKATVHYMTKFPVIPLARTFDVLDDMEQRWRTTGHSLHAVHQHRHQVARHVGDLATAAEEYRRWQAAPRDELSDCAGCDPTEAVIWLAERGRDKEAVALADPVLAGRLSCHEQPQSIQTALLLPLLRTGRTDDAVRAQRAAYRQHRSKLADLEPIAEHIRFCTLTGNDALALEIVQRHLDWLSHPPTPYSDMAFSAAAAAALSRLDQQGHGGLTVRRRVNEGGADEEVGVGELAGELRERALALAEQFDRRNGTTHQSERVAQALAATAVTTQIDLATPGTRIARPAAPRLPDGPTEPEQPDADPQVGADLELDELLDRAEAAHEAADYPTARALARALEERGETEPLTPLQLARRAEVRGNAAAAVQDAQGADAGWSEAADRFAELGDDPRHQNLQGRLGLMRLRTGHEAGAAMVQASTAALVAGGDARYLARAHLRLALAHLTQGRAEEGLRECDQADSQADDASSVSGEIAEARGQLLARLGRIEEAEVEARRARESRRETAPGDLDFVCWLHGWALEQLDRLEEALEAYDEALASDPAPDLARTVSLQRAGMLAYSPRAAESIDVLAEEVARLVSVGADGVPYRQHQLAAAYLNAGRPFEAAEVAEEALAGLAGLDDDDQTFRTRGVLVEIYDALGERGTAVEQLVAQAALLAPHVEQSPHLRGPVGRLHERRGALLDQLDRDAEAAAAYGEAAAAYAPAEDEARSTVRVTGRRALSLLWSRDVEGALSALATAERLAGTLPDDPESAFTRAVLDYDAAQLYQRIERADEATARAAAAVQGFTTIDRPAQAAWAALRLADLHVSAGRTDEARAALQRALDSLPPEEADVRDRLQWALGDLDEQ